MRISDWSSDVCSSDLRARELRAGRETDLVVDDEVDAAAGIVAADAGKAEAFPDDALPREGRVAMDQHGQHLLMPGQVVAEGLLRADLAQHHRIDGFEVRRVGDQRHMRSEEHTSELQSLMRISYAV